MWGSEVPLEHPPLRSYVRISFRLRRGLLDPIIAIILIAALLTGIGLGWFLGSRSSAMLCNELAVLRDKVGVAEQEGALAGQTVQSLRLQLDGVLAERDEARSALEEKRSSLADTQRDLAAFIAGQEAREKAHERQLEAYKEAREILSVQFHEIGGKLLGDARTAFLTQAGEKFAEADAKQQQGLKSLLQPVETTLKRYEEGLQRVEKEREGSYRELQQAVGQLTQCNDQVRKETQRLANVMGSSPKARGRWGEEQLRNILESAGLSENIDFSLQETVSDGERSLRPDCVITLPGDRTIVIDVKCPLVAFDLAFDEEDESRRSELLRQHAAALKTYASELGKKGYWRQFEKSPDFVIMFIPGEHFLSAAAERAPDLIESAFRNGVIIASTINMLALAKIMAGMWRQESLNSQAQELGRVGRELHGRLSTLGGHVIKLGRNLEQANGNFNAMVGSLESQVMTSAKRFEELGAGSGKPIEPLPMVESSPRPVTKLAGPPASANEDDAAA